MGYILECDFRSDRFDIHCTCSPILIHVHLYMYIIYFICTCTNVKEQFEFSVVILLPCLILSTQKNALQKKINHLFEKLLRT